MEYFIMAIIWIAGTGVGLVIAYSADDKCKMGAIEAAITWPMFVAAFIVGVIIKSVKEAKK